jgi:hypothetical protein
MISTRRAFGSAGRDRPHIYFDGKLQLWLVAGPTIKTYGGRLATSRAYILVRRLNDPTEIQQ